MYNGNGNKLIKVVHWNMGSAHWVNIFKKIQLLLEDFNPDVAVISEANIFSENQDFDIYVPGYSLIQPKSMNSLGYSRIAVLVKSGVKVKVLDQFMDNEIASVWLRISGRGTKNLHIGTVYRQHKLLNQDLPNMSGDPAKQATRWRKFVAQWVAAARNTDCIVLGDTNLNFNKWVNPEQEVADMTDMVKAEIETLGFSQYVRNSTRFWPDQEPSLLDQCWTASPQRIISCRNLTRGSSDHNVVEVVVRIRGKPCNPGEILTRNRKDLDPKLFKESISKINWDPLYLLQDLNLANSHFENEILKVLDSMAPMRVIQVRKKHKSWITSDTRNIMIARDTARQIAQTSQLPNDWLNYRQLRNKCSSQCKLDKRNYFRNLYLSCEEDRNIRNLYSLTKNQLGWKTGGPPSSLEVNGKLITAPRDIAETQSNYFEKKVTDLRQKLPAVNEDPLKVLKDSLDKWSQADSCPTFSLKEATLTDVVTAIKSLGNTTAFGHDRLGTMSLKMAAEFLYRPLRHLVNLSITNSTLANKWKIGRIVLLHKGKGLSQTDCSSFRPISLVSVTSKLVEKIVQQQMLVFLETTRQLNQHHNAYRNHHNTTTAIISMTDKLFEATDRNLIATVTTVDESCAFDCVRHNILVDKLKLYNFGNSACKWFVNYLCSRSQYVTIGSKTSSYKSVKTGVPQGSILGPILYTVYINELSEVTADNDCNDRNHVSDKDNLFGTSCLKCGDVTAYADDATIIAASDSRTQNQTKLEENVRKIESFLTSNQLSTNKLKTTIVESMVKQKRWRMVGEIPKLETVSDRGENKVILARKSTRVLGCNIPNNLSWKEHLISGEKPLLQELRKTVGAISTWAHNSHLSAGGSWPPDLSKVKLHICVPSGGGTTNNHLRRLQAVVNNAARFVLGMGRRTKTSTLMSGCGWLSVRELARYHTALAMWNIVHKQAPREISRRIDINADHLLETPRPRIQTTRAGFRFRGVLQWNTLSPDIRNLQFLPAFKKKLKEDIIQKRGVDTTVDPPSPPPEWD